MISFLQGKIKFKEENHIVLDILGIGFKVFCSRRDIAQFVLEKEVELFVYLHRTQTALDLYGFLTKEEKDFFEVLVDISGIGPKGALIIMSAGPIEKLKEAINKGDERFFDKVPGVGQKRIRKIILELSGKIDKEKIIKKPEAKEKDSEIINALINLGFSRSKARSVLSQIPKEIEGTENIIREALKILGK